MQSLACVNGTTSPVDQATISINDRGLLFGDSVYEVLRIYQGRCWLEDSHFDRLKRSLEAMWYVGVDVDAIRRRTLATIAESEVQEGTVYIQITRGVAPRKHTFPNPPVPPSEIIVVKPYDDAPTARLRETGCGVISFPEWRWRRCDVKSTNLLANVLACEAAHRAGCHEAVLVEPDGLVTESTHSSLLWIRDGRVEATPDGHLILPGTSRHFLLTLLDDLGLEFVPTRRTLDELKASDEVFLAGTTIEILGIARIDDEPVGPGHPGPITRKLGAAFREAVDAWLAGASTTSASSQG